MGGGAARGAWDYGPAIVLVDDDPFTHRMLAPRLPKIGTIPAVGRILSASAPRPRSTLEAPRGPVAVVADFDLRATMTGLQLLEEARRRRPDAARILVSGYGREQLGDVHADGAAQAFLGKPTWTDDVLPRWRRASRATLDARAA